MSKNIIDKIIEGSKRRVARRLLKYVRIAFLSAAGILAANFTHDYLIQNRNYKVVEELLERGDKKSDALALERLKENPEFVDKVPEDYVHLTALQRVVNGVQNGVQNNQNLEGLVFENLYSVFLSSEPDLRYFSGTEIGKKIEFIPEMGLAYDPLSEGFYRLDRESQRLEKVVGGVESVHTIDNMTYFVQGKNLFRKKEKGKIELVQKCPETNCSLYPINGIPYLLLFGKIKIDNEKKTSLVSVIGEDTLLKKEIKDLTETIPTLSFDYATRFVYKGGVLYTSNEDNFVRVEKIDRTTYSKDKEMEVKPIFTMIDTPFNRDFDDYLIRDVDGDGTDDVVFMDISKDILLIGGYNTYSVYLKDTKGDYLEHYEIDGSDEESLEFRFDYSGRTNYDWLNPKKLKKEIKAELSRK